MQVLNPILIVECGITKPIESISSYSREHSTTAKERTSKVSRTRPSACLSKEMFG